VPVPCRVRGRAVVQTVRRCDAHQGWYSRPVLGVLTLQTVWSMDNKTTRGCTLSITTSRTRYHSAHLNARLKKADYALHRIWPHIGPTWPHIGPTWPHIGPTWPHIGPTWPRLGHNLTSR
jgi:hypothetical protein